MSIWSRIRSIWAPRAPVLQAERSMPLVEVLTWGEDGRAVTSNWSEETAVDEQLKVSGWVMACAALRVETISTLPTKMQARRGDAWVDLETTSGERAPLQALLETPNPEMTREDLIARIILSLDFGGNALITKERGLDSAFGLGVSALWPIPTDHLRPVPRRDAGGVAHFKKVTYPGYGRTYPKEDVIHLQAFPDPTNPYWGISRAQAAGFAVEADVEGGRYNAKVFKQGAHPAGLVRLKGNPTQHQLDDARRKFEAQFKGAANAGKVAFMGMEADFKPFALDADKLQVTSGREMSRAEVFAAFGVPPVLGGDYGKATYNNTREAQTIYWMMTGLPLARKVYSGLYRGLKAEYGMETRVWFDASGVEALTDISIEQLNKASSLAALGVPMEEINRRLRLGLDESALPAGQVGLTDEQALQQARLGLDLLHTPATSAWAAEKLGAPIPTTEQIDAYWTRKEGGGAVNVLPFPGEEENAA